MAVAFLNLHFLIYTGSHCDVLVTRQEVQLQDYPHSGKEEVECMVFPGHLGRVHTHPLHYKQHEFAFSMWGFHYYHSYHSRKTDAAVWNYLHATYKHMLYVHTATLSTGSMKRKGKGDKLSTHLVCFELTSTKALTEGNKALWPQ